MDIDESIYVGELTRRMNELIMQGAKLGDIDANEVENDVIHSTDIVPQVVRDNVKRQRQKIQRSRNHTARQVQREISQSWKQAIELLDDCLAIADLINSRLVEAVFINGDILRTKNPRPIPETVTGAYVKCLHLLALYGKSCRIAAEAALLLREGFPDGALSRLRTLHEHLAVLFVLHNDHTYELSEAYQDSAVFARLKQLRADQTSFAEPFWRVSAEAANELTAEIAELETLAAEVTAKRGPKIKGQYEWARPIIAEPKRENPKYTVTFSDVEEAAGMDFLHRNYLIGNSRIHADAYTMINHFDWPGQISPIRQFRDDWAIYFTGAVTATLLGWAARAACRGIAWESEEYDELLYVCEMNAVVNETIRAFAKFEHNLNSSDKLAN